MARTASAGAVAVTRSPKARLPTWSWFWMNATKARRRQVRAGLAARMAAIGHDLALKRKALGQRPAQPIRVAGVVGIVARRLTRGRDMQHVVGVVVPLRRVLARAAVRPADQPARLVLLVLQHQMQRPLRCCRADALRQLLQQMRRTVVQQRVHGVEPQAVEVEFLSPVEGVVDDEVPDRAGMLAVEVDRRPPWRLDPVGEGLWGNGMDVGALRPEMVIDDIEQHHQATPVCGIDQRLQIFRPAIGGIRGEGQHPVIAPVAPTRESGHRHELDGGDTQRHEMVELTDDGAKRALRGECAHMQLVEHRLFPRRPCQPASLQA